MMCSSRSVLLFWFSNYVTKALVPVEGSIVFSIFKETSKIQTLKYLPACSSAFAAMPFVGPIFGCALLQAPQKNNH